MRPHRKTAPPSVLRQRFLYEISALHFVRDQVDLVGNVGVVTGSLLSLIGRGVYTDGTASRFRPGNSIVAACYCKGLNCSSAGRQHRHSAKAGGPGSHSRPRCTVRDSRAQ
jgi:hypothetical protein